MANDIGRNPWIIDTAHATNFVFNGWVMPRTIRWVAPAASAGNAVVLKDRNGKIVWESVASGSNYVEAQTLPPKVGWDGLLCTTLASGKVYLEV